MRYQKILSNLDITKDGLVAYVKENSKKNEVVFLKQGDADRACGLYCALMSLIICGAISREDIITQKDKNFRKFLKEFRDFTPLIREGTTATKISSAIKNTFNHEVSFKTKLAVNDELLEILKIQLSRDNPFILGVLWESINDESQGGHWVLVTGVEYENLEGKNLEDDGSKITKIFILDSLGDIPKYSYWNQIILVEKNKKLNKYKWLTKIGNNKGYESITLEHGIVVEDKI